MARADIVLADDWHEITWPGIGVSISIDDLIEQWILKPDLAQRIVISDS